MTQKTTRTPTDGEKTYSREALLKSKRFSQYQKDFLAAVLSEPEYTTTEAEKIVKKFFRKG